MTDEPDPKGLALTMMIRASIEAAIEAGCPPAQIIVSVGCAYASAVDQFEREGLIADDFAWTIMKRTLEKLEAMRPTATVPKRN